MRQYAAGSEASRRRFEVTLHNQLCLQLRWNTRQVLAEVDQTIRFRIPFAYAGDT